METTTEMTVINRDPVARAQGTGDDRPRLPSPEVGGA